MLWQPDVRYMEAATVVKGLMEELNSDLTMESPGHRLGPAIGMGPGGTCVISRT